MSVWFKLKYKGTYLLSWNHNTNLLDSLGKLIGLNSAVSIEIEVLEGLLKNLLLRSNAG